MRTPAIRPFLPISVTRTAHQPISVFCHHHHHQQQHQLQQQQLQQQQQQQQQQKQRCTENGDF